MGANESKGDLGEDLLLFCQEQQACFSCMQESYAGTDTEEQSRGRTISRVAYGGTGIAMKFPWVCHNNHPDMCPRFRSATRT